MVKGLFALFLGLLLAPSFLIGAYQYNLAVCAIFKNNAIYLKEWIEFHRMLGVDHFYLYDNGSSDKPRKVLEDYIKNKIVTLIQWPNIAQSSWGNHKMAWVVSTQLPAYHHGCALAKGKAKWLAFIDTDEFITPIQHQNITSFLEQHDKDPGVCLFWEVYGTSNVYSIPDKTLMIEWLMLKCLPDNPVNLHTKVIVRPEKFKNFDNHPHLCYFTQNLIPYFAPREEIRLNHYINRTIDYFYAHKIKGKETMDNVKWSQEYIDHFLQLGNDVEDRIMDRYIPSLRKRMGFSSP